MSSVTKVLHCFDCLGGPENVAFVFYENLNINIPVWCKLQTSTMIPCVVQTNQIIKISSIPTYNTHIHAKT